MDGASGPQHEWEQWPGRGGPERPRRGLRALFAATEEGDAIDELIEYHGRELEARAASLRRAIDDLEQREERVRGLRASVDLLLREGAAELDERHAELALASQELADREERLAQAEAELEERRSELGAVELRRAAVERREVALDERHVELEQLAERLRERVAEVEARAAQLDERAADADRRADELTQRARDLDEHAEELGRRSDELTARAEELAARAEELAEATDAAAAAAVAATPVTRDDAHVVVVPGAGYRLVSRPGPAPQTGELTELDGVSYRVSRGGRSPLPGDDRRCAYLEPA